MTAERNEGLDDQSRIDLMPTVGHKGLMDFNRSDQQKLLVSTAEEIVEQYGETYFREKRVADEEPKAFLL